MVQLSKRKVKPEIEAKMFRLIFDIVGKQNSSDQFSGVINGLFSPIEKRMVAKRLAIFLLLVKKVEWKTICNILKVSNASVSKCQMILLNNSEIQNAFSLLVSKAEMSIFFDELLLAFFGPGTAYTNWKSGWKRKRELEQKKAVIL